jgi:hypothetical protein
VPGVGETVGIVGTDALGPTVPVMGASFGNGTTCAALTPEFLIPVESNGIPARVPLLDAVDDEVDVGLDDAVMLLEPEPHIPVSPDVSTIPEDADSPDVAPIAVEVDIPDDVDVPDGATPPAVAAVAGVCVPFAIAIPPPS